MLRPLLAPGRIWAATHRRREPHPALVIEHGIVLVGFGVPQNFFAPIRRRRRRLNRTGVARSERHRHARVGHRHLEVRHLVRLRIEYRHHVGRILRRAVERTIGIDCRLAPIRRDQVVQIFVGRRPFPRGDDDVALDAGRPLRLVLRQFALGDTIGPVAEILVRHPAKLAGDAIRHHLAGLPGRDATNPCLLMRLEFSKLRGDRPRRFLTELMAADAVDVVHALEPGLARDGFRNIGRAAEILRRRDLHHRVPIDRRVVMRGGLFVRRLHRSVVEPLARLCPHLRRIDESVSTHPDLVVGDRKVGNDVAALIVGDDALDVAGRQIGGLRDHPDSGFRTVRSADHAADIITIDRDRCSLLRVDLSRPRRKYRKSDSSDGRIQNLSHPILPGNTQA